MGKLFKYFMIGVGVYIAVTHMGFDMTKPVALCYSALIAVALFFIDPAEQPAEQENNDDQTS